MLLLIALGFVLVGALSFIALIFSSLFFRIFPNPLMPDTPWNRVWVRGFGLIVSLFVLTALSGGFEGFHANILLALWLSPFTLPILMWLLWRFSVRSFMRQCYINGTNRDPAWERRMTFFFCSILVLTIATAWLLAASGHYIPLKSQT